MSHDSADPSTPQRPLPSPLDEDVVTPSRLGLLQTPPRRPGRGLKRPAETEPDASGRREASPLRLLQTPPQRPPRRARFSTGFVDLATLGPADTTSHTDRPVSDREGMQRCTPDAQLEDEHRDEETLGRWDENKIEHEVQHEQQRSRELPGEHAEEQQREAKKQHRHENPGESLTSTL
ncbi:hypothetical protein CI238_10635 [Colletotrichum incanum]|uniref:Uncharacterized protein n=1 Tax=Colletotrichum incanum TaxID=1573173 RepID=A0A167BQ47_COLIC|nr:hypothetical protein CI238_10635 [Colletotrichum incanum]